MSPAPAPAPSAPPATPSGDAVASKVLDIVADKTGYPQDMLELDLDLEADLGIDTVKQAETLPGDPRGLRHPLPGGPEPARLSDAGECDRLCV